MRLLLLVLLLVPAAARGQNLNFGEDEEAYQAELRQREERRNSLIPYATAVTQYFSSATWHQLKVSTTPVVDITRLLQRGYYRREVIELVLLADKARVPLLEVVNKRDEGAALKDLAAGYKIDAVALREEAEKKRAIIELILPTISTVTVNKATETHKLPGLKDAPSEVQTELSTTTIGLPGGQLVRTELAIKDAERERGLMYRTKLDPDYGMLFVFEEERTIPFWMMNTWVDLDIIYIGADKRITKIFHKVPRSYPDTPREKVVTIHAQGLYVLELPAGAAKRYKLKKGDLLKFKLNEKR